MLQFQYAPMRLPTISSSAKIYIDQINNFIQTGQGYEQLRVHLLKQLNSIDPDNPSSDETLVPALIQNLRKCLLSQSSELKSRTIDVLQDVIKHADQVVDGYITTQDFCITLSISISYKLFNPFSKALFDQNRLRLSSLVMFYHEKFQQDPSRYFHVFQLYKQLKEKNFTLPPKTFIEIPKLNQFKKSKPKTPSQNSSQSDRVGVTFDSIIEFVKDCDRQFTADKMACANTQFVRALKVKAKTLFDLSQNSQGLQLNAKQKQHAKQLYKQIRTMLKEIEKISEQKIKDQKIKSEKEFAQEKIEQITPNKKKESAISVESPEKKLQTKPSTQTVDLLQNVGNVSKPDEIIRTPNKKVPTPSKPSSFNLLDEEPDQNVEEEQFTEFTSQTTETKQKTPFKQLAAKQDSKPSIKKLPKPQEYKVQPAEEQLIEVGRTSLTPKKNQFTKLQAEVVQTLHARSFQKKSLPSRHSIHSQQGDRAVNLLDTEPASNCSKSQQSEKLLQFQNAQHFSKFQIVNNYIQPNKYGQIPLDVDFSDSSSQQSAGSHRIRFQIGQNLVFEEDTKRQPYDTSFLTPKKQSSHQENNNHQKEIQKLSLSANMSKQQQQQLVANLKFGILADAREVKAYDYSQYQAQNLERSSISNISEEDRKITLTPHSVKKQETTSLNQLSPREMKFNSQKKKAPGNQLLEQGGDSSKEQEFGNYQQVPNVLGVEVMSWSPEKQAGKKQDNQEKILQQATPQKGQLVKENQQEELTSEPLL